MTEKVIAAKTDQINETALEKITQEYSKAYLDNDDLSLKHITTIDNNVETMLTKLDEFGALIDTVQSDVSKASQALGVLYDQSKQIESLFSVIDKLEVFVQQVKQSVDNMDEQITNVETFNRSKSFSKLLVLPFGKKSAVEEVPEFYKTEIVDPTSFFKELREAKN